MSTIETPVTTSDKPLFPTSESQAVDRPAAGTETAMPMEDAASRKSPVDDVLERVRRGAHEAIDGVADRVAPHAQRLDADVGDARDTLNDSTRQLADVRDQWMDLARQIVRDHPLATLAAALAVGMLISRVGSLKR